MEEVNFLLKPVLLHLIPSKTSCPFKGNITVKNLKATDFNLPPIIPAGEYRIDTRIYDDKNKTIVFPRIYFEVKHKGIIDMAMG